MNIRKLLTVFVAATFLLGPMGLAAPAFASLELGSFSSEPEEELSEDNKIIEEQSREGALGAPVFVSEEIEEQASPVLTTSAPDYSPGEKATILGKFFQALQQIWLKIFAGSQSENNYIEHNSSLVADENGEFVYDYHLDSIFRPLYTVVARDSAGSELAQAIFTDSGVDVFDQWANKNNAWDNGNLNGNNSSYQESEATVQRLVISGLDVGAQYTVTIQYGTTRSGKHAYDFLTSWNHSENLTEAQLCQGISSCAYQDSSLSKLDMKNDPMVPDVFEPNNPGDRQFVMYGGTINNSSVPVLVSGDYAGNSETEVTVTFTANSDMCSVQGNKLSCKAAIWFGAHIAGTANWLDFNGTTGAGTINGSPYHVSISAFNEKSVGNRDNQMQASAIVPAESGTLIVKKSVINDDGGGKQASDFSFKVNDGNWQVFIQDGGDQTKGYNQFAVDVGTYNITEGPMTGYAASYSGCANITIANGKTKICEITNNDIAPKLKLVKTVINDNGGTKQVSDFPLFIGSTQVISGEFNDVEAGQEYMVSETSLSGYAASAWGGDCSSDGKIILQLGEEKACTITNDDQPGKLLVKKIVKNDSGLNKTADNFSFQVNSGAIIPFEADGENELSVSAGVYSVTEPVVNGYLTSYKDCADIIIANGETKTCTITNDDQAGKIVVKKIAIGGGGEEKFAFSSNYYPNFNLGDQETYDSGYLVVGAYNVSEAVPVGWSLAGAECGNGITTTTPENISLKDREVVTCTFTNVKLGKITIVKEADPKDCKDFSFTGDLGGFVLDDDEGSETCTDQNQPKEKEFANLSAGNYLINETPASYWQLKDITCSGASIYATSTTGTTINLKPGEEVVCTFYNEKLSPSRTQGFWKTHTIFTSGVFSSHFPSGMILGNNPKKTINDAAELFATWYSDLNFKSSIVKKQREKRTELDKARLLLAHQLVTAKLNQAAFGASAAVVTMISSADAAYSGTNINNIKYWAGQLDIFNNSGDSILLESNPGKATPQSSNLIAEPSLWDSTLD